LVCCLLWRTTFALRIVAACEAVSCLVTPDLKRIVNVDVTSVTAIIFERLL